MWFRNSLHKLRHTRSVAYLVELVLLNKHQISGGGAYLDCYRNREIVTLQEQSHFVHVSYQYATVLLV